MDRDKAVAVVGFAIMGLCLAALTALGVGYAWQGSRANDVDPAPASVRVSQSYEALPEESASRSDAAPAPPRHDAASAQASFPEVDWTYWQGVNSDVVA